MGQFFEDSGTRRVPDQEPCWLPESHPDIHHAITDLQHPCIFSMHFWNFEQHALIAVFQCHCMPCFLQVVSDGQQGPCDLVSLFKLCLIPWRQIRQPPYILPIIAQGHWCSSTWLPMPSRRKGLARNVQHASHTVLRDVLIVNDLCLDPASNCRVRQIAFDDPRFPGFPINRNASIAVD